MLKELLQSMFSYIPALRYVLKLYKYLVFILLLLLLFLFPILLIDEGLQGISKLIPYHSSQKYASMSVQFIANISGFFLLLILSPVFSMASEEVIHLLNGKTYKFSPTQLIKDVIRGVKITIRNLFYEYLYILIISIILYFLPENPVIKVLGFVANTLVVSYFYGFSLLDYALENHRINYKKSVAFVRSHAGIAIGLGLMYYLMISINDISYIKGFFGHFGIYWTAFGEALVAFTGVIAGSIILNKKLSSQQYI